ncbi:MAG: D-alanyl-D-alanine carboxypeptidase [Clostridia bacterium]|nr:D-alanyl-D-alanine carboxypeptidase [Clostridia bacterium]
MKKIISILCTLGLIGGYAATTGFEIDNSDKNITVGCKSAYLMDYNSGECIYKQNECERLPIASMCKVMTLTLVMDAVDSGKLALEDMITVSDNASGMGGSQVFLASGCQYSVDQLIKSIIVCSANDSCVALSETVAGSEDSFVAEMNKKAVELGCNDTLFANCTGLPKPTQYSCAKDVALMFRNLLKYENYFNYSKIWLEDFVHPDDRVTSMTNTNKLLRKYKLCDGGKTGFTNEAGFCFTATAKKDNLRLISAVLGADSSDHRFDSTVNMFNYGFANFRNKIILDKDMPLNDEFAVSGGKKQSFAVCPEKNCYVFTEMNKEPEISYNVISHPVKAPIVKGQNVGTIEIYKDGVLYETVSAVSAEDVKKASFGDNFQNISSKWAI